VIALAVAIAYVATLAFIEFRLRAPKPPDDAAVAKLHARIEQLEIDVSAVALAAGMHPESKS
jgi:hypothetical protein